MKKTIRHFNKLVSEVITSLLMYLLYYKESGLAARGESCFNIFHILASAFYPSTETRFGLWDSGHDGITDVCMWASVLPTGPQRINQLERQLLQSAGAWESDSSITTMSVHVCVCVSVHVCVCACVCVCVCVCRTVHESKAFLL